MLRITEHIEYYSNNHFSYLEQVREWQSYFGTSKKEDTIAIDSERNFASIILQKKEEEQGGEAKYSCQCYSSYFIGLDRFPILGLNVYIAPKLNTEQHQLNYVQLLLESLKEPENFEHLDGLFTMKLNDEWIEIENNEQPLLTPFLMAQFLSLVKILVKKGLKKSYYTKTENLRSRIRGKILVGTQIKQNVLKNRITNTVCQHQEFGLDTEVNQFIKYVLHRVYHNLDNYAKESELYKNLIDLVHFSKGGFQQVSDVGFSHLSYKENNPFFRIYNQVVALGNQILRLEDYNIAKASKRKKVKHPPFWIDMSKLFELYVFKKLKERFQQEGEVKYHLKFNRQEPDFIIHEQKENGIKAVVDAKYKPRYKSGNPSMKDARQLAGYTRLNKIYEELKVDDYQIISAFFIYPAELCDQEKEPKEKELIEKWNDDIHSVLKNTSSRKSTTYKEMYLQEVSIDTE